MSFKLDMSKFKKVGGDKNHTILKHKDGHEIRIAHKALSVKMRDQLAELPQKMSDGGEVEKAPQKPEPKKTGIPGGAGSPYIDKSAAQKSDEYYKNHPHDTVEEMANNFKKAFHFADGGQVDKNGPPEIDKKKAQEFEKGFNDPDPIVRAAKKLFMADGGPVASQSAAPEADSPEKIAMDAAAAQQAPMAAPQAAPSININVGQPQAPVSSPADLIKSMMGPLSSGAQQDLQNISPMQARPELGYPAKGMAPEASQMPAEAAPSAPQASGLAQVAAAPQAAPHDASDPYGYGQQAQTMQQGINEQGAGLKQQAQAQGAIAQDEQKALEANQQGIQDALLHFQTKDKEINAHIDTVLKEIDDGKIDPNRFWEQKSTPSKIGTIIGLILGGGGAALAGQENLAYKALQSNIERDIDAQKANLGKKNTLLEAYYRKLGNVRDATDMTRVMLNAASLNDLKLAAAKQGTPMAQALYKQAEGKLITENAPVIAQIKRNQAMIGLMKDAQTNPDKVPGLLNGLRQIDPAKAKELEERYVPGVGVANVPVQAAVRDQLVAKQQLGLMANDFYNWAKKHSGTVLDRSTVNEGATKAAELQSLYRNAINGGVFKKGEQEFIDQIVDSDPTKFFNKVRVLPKLKEVINSNDAQLNTLKRSVGLPEAAAQNSPVRGKDGRMYIKDPSGRFMIPVK